MLEKLLNLGREIIPDFLFRLGQPIYHYKLALLAALIYRFPSGKIKVVMITGTKGKSTTAELVNSILEAADLRTALTSTIRTKIGETAYPNLLKMTTPGRFFLQKFLRRAVSEKCEWAVIEMTSQAVAQYRHKFIDLDALIFTGIHPEHIESHGSFDKYLEAKLELARTRPHIIVSNLDDIHGQKFLDFAHEKKIGFRLENWTGTTYKTNLIGDFNKRNILAATGFAQAIGIPEESIASGIANLKQVPGRMEFVPNNLGIEVVVDYAHTTGSLQAVYEALRPASPELQRGEQAQGKSSQPKAGPPRAEKLICVLGACGGGRDKWKRSEFGKIAEQYCDYIILTNEDPYDENPWRIVEEIESGISDKSKYEVEINRRKAINKALQLALQSRGRTSGAEIRPLVLITGKGTDPYIMGPGGTKQSWSDAQVVREELAKLTQTSF